MDHKRLLADSVVATCRDIYIAAELHVKYEGQLEHIRTSGYSIGLEYNLDEKTLSLLENRILPMPNTSVKDRLPYEVWYFRAWFIADPSKELEILIGMFNRKKFQNIEPLGMHDGWKWVYTPLTYPPRVLK